MEKCTIFVGMNEDVYRTIAAPAEGIYTEKRSKFIAIALPVRTVDEVKALLEEYQKKYYDARHVCYAYMLGPSAKTFGQMIMASRRVRPESLSWDR